MQITLRCFSVLQEIFATKSLLLDVPEGAQAKDVEAIVRQRGGERIARTSFRIAVNKEYVGPEHMLRDGDEVAILPPLQGG